MINWQYIEKKREKYYKRYTNVFYEALQMTILPVLQESRINYSGTLPIDDLIKDDYIRKAYTSLYLDVGKVFIKDFVKILSKDFNDDLWDMEIMQYIDTKLGNEITLVTNYTKETIQTALKKVMNKGVQEGLSVGDIMKNLRTELTKGDYATFTKARALRIAKTETMKASNKGSYTAAQLSGAGTKTWVTAPIGVAKTERHNILGMNGVKIGFEDLFNVDGEYMSMPGDDQNGASARNIINCNCGLIYG